MNAVAPILITAVAVATVLSTGAVAVAAPIPGCLNKGQERAAIAEGQAVKLAVAITAVRVRPGEVISARLCHGAKGLEYVLTLLAHDGKVTRATVDAGSGTVIGRR